MLVSALGEGVLAEWERLGRDLIATQAGGSRSRRGRLAGLVLEADPQVPPEREVPRNDHGDLAQQHREFQDLVVGTVARMLRHARAAGAAESAPIRQGLVWVFLYLQGLISWEYTDDPLDRIRDVISSLDLLASLDDLEEIGDPGADVPKLVQKLRDEHEARTDSRVVDLVPARGSDSSGALLVTWASIELLRSLVWELRTENALFCSCPDDFTRQAVRAASAAQRVEQEVVRFLDECDGDGVSRPMRFLLGLLREDAARTSVYFRFLGEHVGPASRAFVGALWGECSRQEASSRLEDAAAMAAVAEGELETDVLALEVRAHRRVLLDLRSAIRQRDTLFVEKGEIVLLFPFGMPDTDAEALIDRLLDTGRGPTVKWLQGLAVKVDGARRTDSWQSWDNQTVAGRPNRTATITFAKHDAVLLTTAPARIVGLHLSIELGSLGNHYVRVAVSTDTEVVYPARNSAASPDANGACADDPLVAWTIDEELPLGFSWEVGEAGWTAHEIDQWIRRATYQFGNERVLFVDRESGVADPNLETGSIVRLARMLIDDFAPRARRLAPSPVGHSQRHSRVSSHDPFNDMHLGAHAVALIERAVLRRPDEDVPLTNPSELNAALGSSALLMAQRQLPSSLEEWARFDPVPPPNLLESIGLPNDLICRTRDVTLMCMLDSPGWAVLSLKEIVEFAGSVSGVYNAWAIWLRSIVRVSGQLVHDPAITGASAGESERELARRLEGLLLNNAEIAANLSEVRSLLGHFRSAQLIRTGSERQLLDRLLTAGGLDKAEQSLLSSVESLTAQQQLVASQTELILEQRRRREEDERRSSAERTERSQARFERLLGLLTVFGVTGIFAWYDHEFPAAMNRPFGWIEPAILVALVVVAVWVLGRVAYERSSRRRVVLVRNRLKEAKMKRETRVSHFDERLAVVDASNEEDRRRRREAVFAAATDERDVRKAIARIVELRQFKLSAEGPRTGARGWLSVDDMSPDECKLVVMRHAY